MSVQPAKTYYDEINGLRAIAVLAVIIHHIDAAWMPSGFLGVDIFFVISGFVITSSLTHYEPDRLGRQLVTFYARRIKRLFPALFVMVAATGLLACLFSSAARESMVTGLYSLIGLSNGYLYWISTDYFGQSADLNFFTHTWSLGVEEQFYLLYPVLFLVLASGAGRVRRIRAFTGIIVALSVLSLVLFVWLYNAHVELVFFMMPFRFWELGTGVLIYLLVQRRQNLSGWLQWIDARVLVICMLFVLMLPGHYQMYAYPISVMLTALMLLSIGFKPETCRLLSFRPLVYIGIISYSLYLWHWSVLVLARWTVGISSVTIPGLVILMFLLAAFSYHFVEKRLRRQRWFGHFIWDFAAVLCVSFVLVIVGLKAAGEEKSRLYLAAGNSQRTQMQQSKLPALGAANPAGAALKASLDDLRYQCNMTPNFLPGVHKRPQPTVDKKFLKACLGGDKPKLVLMGDSFSSVIARHTFLVAKEIGYEFKFLYGFVCPYPLDKQNIDLATQRTCNGDSAELQQGILELLNPGDLVVLRLLYYNPSYINVDFGDFERVVHAYDSELASLKEGIRRRGAGLLLVGQNGIRDSLEVCNNPAWFNALQCAGKPLIIDMDSSRINQLVVAFNDNLLQQFNEPDGAVQVLDPLEELCDSTRQYCWIKNNDIYAMTDDYHMSGAAVDLLYDDLRTRLLSISESCRKII